MRVSGFVNGTRRDGPRQGDATIPGRCRTPRTPRSARRTEIVRDEVDTPRTAHNPATNGHCTSGGALRFRDDQQGPAARAARRWVAEVGPDQPHASTRGKPGPLPGRGSTAEGRSGRARARGRAAPGTLLSVPVACPYGRSTGVIHGHSSLKERGCVNGWFCGVLAGCGGVREWRLLFPGSCHVCGERASGSRTGRSLARVAGAGRRP